MIGYRRHHPASVFFIIFAVTLDLFHVNHGAFLEQSRHNFQYIRQQKIGAVIPSQWFKLRSLRSANLELGETPVEYDDLDNALIDLGLTSEQVLDVCIRAQNNVNQGKGKRATYDPIGNLNWLKKNLFGSNFAEQKNLVALVVGHPSVLGYSLEKNLGPTVEFYAKALDGEEMVFSDFDGCADWELSDAIIGKRIRVANFLSQTPGLLEYNIEKRLRPRLARFFTARGSITGQVEEECIRAIATKTDSRFEEWILNEGVRNVDGQTGKIPLDKGECLRTPPKYRNGPSCFVVLSNLQSGSNIGNIVRSASIFGCDQVVVVGQRRYRLTGDHGSRFDIERRHMYTHQDAKVYLQTKGVRIYGIEITDDAEPIMKYDPDTGKMKFPFDRTWAQGAAFVFGNEGMGLSEKQRSICDEFVFVPQTRGGGGSASLNVACAASVVLQAYCIWAGYPEAQRKGEKFVAVPGEDEPHRFQHSFNDDVQT